MQKQRIGEFSLLAFTFFEGWFPVLTLLILQYINPIYSYLLTVCFASLTFLSVLIIQGKLYQLVQFSAWRPMLLSASLMSLAFIFIYAGLTWTSAGNMSILIFLQFFFSFVYFNLIGKEPFSRQHLVGAFLMAIGAIIILFPQNWSFNKGDLLIVLASAIAPIANYYQKEARQQVSSSTVLTFRSFFAIPVLFLLANVLEPQPQWQSIEKVWVYIAICGILLMGLSKILWLEGIHRISITKASAMMALIPVFTLLFSWLLFNTIPDTRQLMAIVPVIYGGFLLTRAI